jgi:flagellar basal body-associated protein FliL
MDSLYIILGVVLLVIVIGLLAYFTENGKQRHLNEQRKLAEQKRVDTIRVKYPDPEIQNKIINGSV